MYSKLTLRLDSNIIARAKKFAEKNKTSLSKMIESYFDSVTREVSSGIEITPLVDSLSGVIVLPEDFDYRESYSAYLDQKHS